jgi:hypothetical protein
MGTGSEETQVKHQFFAARAEQAEKVAGCCKDPLAGEAWATIAKMWRLLADNAGKEIKL